MRSRGRRNSATLLACLFLCSALQTSCRTNKKPATGDNQIAQKDVAPGEAEQAVIAIGDEPPGLQIRLSEGVPAIASADRPTVAPAQKLSEADASRLLARLSQLVAEPDDKKDFALRAKSLPPPRTGKTIQGQFPPPPSKAVKPQVVVKGTELKVNRFAPEGEVPVAPHVSITFNQPMVAVTSHADTVAHGVPVKLSPQPKGKWRWLGTKTLMFDPAVRFPAATEYKVVVAEGTKSASGAVLKKQVEFSFATPAPKLVRSWPPNYQPQKREPVMFAQFDQKIDPAAVLDTVTVSSDKGRHKVRLATAEEIADDDAVTGLIEAADKDEQEGRYLAFVPTEPLPHDSYITVEVGPGTPSAEGPRKTRSSQSFRFRTYGPLKVVEWRCSWGNNCPPGTPWSIRFTNPLDGEELDHDAIEISPELSGKKILPSGQWMTIQGRSQGRTTYEVTLPATLEDSFGQTLGKEQTLTFRVGDADPRLFGATGLTLLDPVAKKPTYNLHSINIKSLDVEVYKVSPKDWPQFLRFMQKNPRQPVRPPGTRVVKDTVKLKGSPDEMVETGIDLAKALNTSGHGHAVVVVTPTVWPDRYKPELNAWVQATEIGLDAFVDSTDLLAWATRLSDGKPLSGVELAIEPSSVSKKSSGDGTAELPLPKSYPKDARPMLVARRGSDVAFLPQSTYAWSSYGGWRRSELGEHLSWYVYDDRQMYKPGETVRLKGWLRLLDRREGGDLSGIGGQVNTVRYEVMGPRGNSIAKGTAKVNALGGFDTRFELPKTPNLGYARVQLEAVGKRGGSHTHNFQIQEFRRPEYEVSTSASQGPHLVAEHADITVTAAYYAGGGLQNAEVNWSVRSEPTNFKPPGNDDFTFGFWEPWWTGRWGMPDQTKWESYAGTTDATGKHILRADFVSINPPRPMSLIAEARVTDVNRQSWASQTAMVVHPSELYVGLKQPKYFVDQGTPVEVAAIAVDHDGALAAGKPIELKAVRLDWNYKNGEYVQEEVDPQACTIAAKPVADTCTFDTPDGGTYRVTGTVIDDKGRPSQTQIMFWVSGGELPPARNVEQQEAMLIPDGKEYRPGQTAKLLVQSPFFPAQGLLTIRRSGIVESRVFTMDGPTATLEVPIVEGHVPNVTVQVDLVGSAERVDDDGKPAPKLPRRPAYAAGSIELPVPPVTRSLKVAVKPRQSKIEPRGFTRVDVSVTDILGKPVSGAELAVVVVDEAVLALSDYQSPDPLAAFYGTRPAGASDYHLRQHVALARPDDASLATGAPMEQAEADMAVQSPAPMAPGNGEASGALGGVAADEGRMSRRERAPARVTAKKGKSSSSAANANTPIAVRKNFGALAVFAPEIRTDRNGKADVAVKVPDNLTRYRVMVAVVAGDNKFGAGESNITARMPLMVRPSPPRFLNFGDTFELPVVVQNQTDRDMQVDVAVRATNAALTDGSGRQVTVPANDRVEVRFPSAAEMAGTARFQIGVQSGRHADAAELSLPVWTPATTEAFAVYGEIDKGAIRQPVAMPKDVVKQFGGLEITTSSTQLQALTDAFLYLVSYPFDCAEQTASRIMAVAGLRDVLSAFEAEGLPEPAELAKVVDRDIKHLQSLQNHDGGFAFWARGHESWPYISIHAGHALMRAKQKGYDVPEAMISRNQNYLKNIKRHLPWYYPEPVKRTLRSYALYVRKRMGDTDVAEAKQIVREAGGPDKLSMEAVGWLLFVMSGEKNTASDRQAIHRLLDNRAIETAAAAHWQTSYADGAHLILHSDRRVDGIVLEALIEDKPKSDLIAKVVRGLLAHRKAGRWQNTQENAFVLLAMDRYFGVYEKVTPNFVSRIWLGDDFAGQHAFKGRQTDRHHIDIPMSFLAKRKGGQDDLIVQKDGKGRLYYRVGMTYAPSSLWLPPDDHGFAVERIYEPIDDPKDVVRQKDGSWKIKAGARVRVRLTMVAEARRYHVALVDKLPAGLEPSNPALAVTGTLPQDPKQQQGKFWWWMRTWYEHQNMRDERVEAFASLLWAGVHDYSYVAQATTPGNFVVPPAHAEEMYFPETFGRSSSDRVIIE